MVCVLHEVSTERDPSFVAAAPLVKNMSISFLPHIQAVFQNDSSCPDWDIVLVHPLLHRGRNRRARGTPIPADPSSHMCPFRWMVDESDDSAGANWYAFYWRPVSKRRDCEHRRVIQPHHWRITVNHCTYYKVPKQCCYVSCTVRSKKSPKLEQMSLQLPSLSPTIVVKILRNFRSLFIALKANITVLCRLFLILSKSIRVFNLT